VSVRSSYSFPILTSPWETGCCHYLLLEYHNSWQIALHDCYCINQIIVFFIIHHTNPCLSVLHNILLLQRNTANSFRPRQGWRAFRTICRRTVRVFPKYGYYIHLYPDFGNTLLYAVWQSNTYTTGLTQLLKLIRIVTTQNRNSLCDLLNIPVPPLNFEK